MWLQFRKNNKCALTTSCSEIIWVCWKLGYSKFWWSITMFPANIELFFMIYYLPHFQTNSMIHMSIPDIPYYPHYILWKLIMGILWVFLIFSRAHVLLLNANPFSRRLKRKVGKQLPSWGCQLARSEWGWTIIFFGVKSLSLLVLKRAC